MRRRRPRGRAVPHPPASAGSWLHEEKGRQLRTLDRRHGEVQALLREGEALTLQSCLLCPALNEGHNFEGHDIERAVRYERVIGASRLALHLRAISLGLC